MTDFGQFAPDLLVTDYGNEIWALFQCGPLDTECALTGKFAHVEKDVDLNNVMRAFNDTL